MRKVNTEAVGWCVPWLFQQFEFGDSAEEASSFVNSSLRFFTPISKNIVNIKN